MVPRDTMDAGAGGRGVPAEAGGAHFWCDIGGVLSRRHAGRVGSDDKTVRIWDAASGECVVGPLDGHTRV